MGGTARPGALDVVPAGQWEFGATIERGEVIAGIGGIANPEHGAVEADGSRFLEGETDGLGGTGKAARTLRNCSLTVAAEIKLGASVEVLKCH